MASERALRLIEGFQQGELNESLVYAGLARGAKGAGNRQALQRLSEEERRHYLIWKGYTGKELRPDRRFVRRSLWAARIFGFTFAAKRMENGESRAQKAYAELFEEAPESRQIMEDERSHEAVLIGMTDEEKLRYVGSMVLGMNDALVELTGTLAGLTLAMQNTRLIALSGLITGISATLSMASSEYLSSKSEGRPDALRSSVYTGLTYLVTVALEIVPFLVFPPEHYLYALFSLIAIVILIIAVFSYYISVVQDLSFARRFGEMAGISLSVAALSFVIGLLVKRFLGVEI